MLQNKILLVGKDADGIQVCLAYHLGNENVFAANNVAEIQRALNYNDGSGDHDKNLWKVVVLGQDGGLEPLAKIMIDELRKSFFPREEVPILLVTQTSEANAQRLSETLNGKASVFRADPDVNFQCVNAVIDRHRLVPQRLVSLRDDGNFLEDNPVFAETAKTTSFIEMLTAWVRKSPENRSILYLTQ